MARESCYARSGNRSGVSSYTTTVGYDDPEDDDSWVEEDLEEDGEVEQKDPWEEDQEDPWEEDIKNLLFERALRCLYSSKDIWRSTQLGSLV